MNNQIAQSPKEPSTALVNLVSVSSWKVTSNLRRPEWLCPSRLLPPTPSQRPHLLLRGEKLIPSAMETCRKSEWKAGQCSWIIKQKREFDKILGGGGGFLRPWLLWAEPEPLLQASFVSHFNLPAASRSKMIFPAFFSSSFKKKKNLVFYFPSCVKGGNSDRDKWQLANYSLTATAVLALDALLISPRLRTE